MIRRLEREPIGQIEAIWLPIDLHSFEPRPAFLADVFAHELPLEAAWYTRRGARYPAFASTAAKLRARSFDGEAVVCGPDGVAIFDALHRRGTVTEAMLYAFDLLELDGEDLRALPLGDRKKKLARLLARRSIGIVLSDHTDEGGALLFVHACRMGQRASCSKRLSAPYRSGRSRDWLKLRTRTARR